MNNDKLCTLLEDSRFVELCSRLKTQASGINGLACENMVQLAEMRGKKAGIEASISFLTTLRKKGKGNGATI